MTERKAVPALVALSLVLTCCGDPRPLGSASGDQPGVCITCHGGVDNETGAPPYDVGHGTDTSRPTVGAHTAHVEAGSLAGALACTECHPQTTLRTPTHMNGQVDLVFGSLATAGGTLGSRFDLPTASCAAVYCHGATLDGGSNQTPVWTRVGQGQAACGACHGLPPGRLSGGGTHPAVGSSPAGCAQCHPRTVKPDGTIDVAGGKHVNGRVEGYHPDGWYVAGTGGDHGPAADQGLEACTTCHGATLTGGIVGVSCDACHNGGAAWRTDCTFCHGDPTRQPTSANPRLPAAPPADVAGGTATSLVTVGAHQSHLTAAHGLSNPITCDTCHVVPSNALDPGHVDEPTATLTWSGLATVGSASPTWDRTQATCASTYCHGNFANGANATAIWTALDGSQRSCTSCHGAPPDSGQHYRHVVTKRMDCFSCHNGIASGALGALPNPPIVNGAITGPALHANGVKDVVLFNGKTWDGTQWYGTCSAPTCH